MLDQINLLKKPKTNIQIVQKNVLTKYKVFTEFFKDQNPGVIILFYYHRYSQNCATHTERSWLKYTCQITKCIFRKFTSSKYSCTQKLTKSSQHKHKTWEHISHRPNLPILTRTRRVYSRLWTETRLLSSISNFFVYYKKVEWCHFV